MRGWKACRVCVFVCCCCCCSTWVEATPAALSSKVLVISLKHSASGDTGRMFSWSNSILISRQTSEICGLDKQNKRTFWEYYGCRRELLELLLMPTPGAFSGAVSTMAVILVKKCVSSTGKRFRREYVLVLIYCFIKCIHSTLWWNYTTTLISASTSTRSMSATTTTTSAWTSTPTTTTSAWTTPTTLISSSATTTTSAWT